MFVWKDPHLSSAERDLKGEIQCIFSPFDSSEKYLFLSTLGEPSLIWVPLINHSYIILFFPDDWADFSFLGLILSGLCGIIECAQK